jgi:O-antigen/teichoic acid export membrane protein
MLRYLGSERYGIWLTLASSVALLQFSDLGMGNGLVTSISRADGRDSIKDSQQYVTSALVVLMALAFVIVFIYRVVSHFVQWNVVFGVSNPAAVRELGPALSALLVCTALTLPLAVAQKIQVAFQEGFKNNLWQLVGSILSLGAVILAVYMKATLPVLILAFTGSPLIVAAANSAYVFLYERPYLRPRFAHFSLRAARELLGIGSAFTILSLSASLAFASDNLVISHILGPSRVPDFAVPARIFGILSGLIISCLTPLWPAYGEAAARGDIAWIKSTLARSLWASVTVSVAIGFIAFATMPTLLHHWIGREFPTPLLLAGGLALWVVVQAGSAAVSVLLNGLNIMRPQILIACVFTPLCILLKIVFTKSIGLPGPVLATIFVYLLAVVLPYYFIVPRVLRGLQRDTAQ